VKNLKPLPVMPEIKQSSPEITKIFDFIRFDLEKQEGDGQYAEFCWFVREYSRAYRYHIECSEYRLERIYSIYEDALDYFDDQIKKIDEKCFGMSFSNKNAYIVYWEFESFLSSISIALDLLARLIGTAYKDHMPPSFNKICKKDLEGPIRDLQRANSIWVFKLKDYRDCFVHYTPVDTLLNISANLYSDGWEVRAKLPINPNVRDILNFKYNRRIELLKYTIATYKHMIALDKRLANSILKLYKTKQFPVRINNLFSVGVRS